TLGRPQLTQPCFLRAETVRAQLLRNEATPTYFPRTARWPLPTDHGRQLPTRANARRPPDLLTIGRHVLFAAIAREPPAHSMLTNPSLPCRMRRFQPCETNPSVQIPGSPRRDCASRRARRFASCALAEPENC